jgi:hypothetical protein
LLLQSDYVLLPRRFGGREFRTRAFFENRVKDLTELAAEKAGQALTAVYSGEANDLAELKERLAV